MLEIIRQFEKLEILKKNEELGRMLKNKPKVTHIPVKYIRAINPFGEEVLVSEADINKAKELGLSLRRIEDE